MLTACAGAAAAGTILLDTNLGNNTTSRTNTGPGQGVSVGVNTVLNQIGFYMDAPAGGNIKFMIWNGTNSQLLFSEVQPVVASNSIGLVLSTPFVFDLTAGQTYYFGVIADTSENVSYFAPEMNLTENNLTLVNPNSNYIGFFNPMFQDYAAATIALQLVGTQVPEPATGGLLLLGALALLAGRKYGTR